MAKPTVTVQFETTLYTLKSVLILALPDEASVALPSRGQMSVTGTMNGQDFQAVLEPDGRWGHWFRVSEALQKAGLKDGDVVTVSLQTTSVWPEPTVPSDVEQALAVAPEKVKEKWQDITPMARWEWMRWINATKNPETRLIRIEKTISKLNGKHRRPCCFNLAACTDMELAKNGQLDSSASG